MSFDSLGSLDLLSTLISESVLRQNKSNFREQTFDGVRLDTTQKTPSSTSDLDFDFTTLKTYSTTLEKVLRHSIEDSLSLGDVRLTTEDLLGVNNSQTEVTIHRPEVLDDAGFGTAEKVVVGAVIIVIILTIFAIILRLCMPIYRNRSKTDQSDKTFYIDGADNTDLSGYTNFAIDITSHSSENSQNNHWTQTTGSNPSSDWSPSTGSNSSSDWSEVSSEQTKSTTSGKESNESENNMSDRLHRHPGNISLHSNYKTASTTSLPLYIQNERLSKSAKSSPIPYRKSPMNNRKYTDEMASVISTKSLEPVRMEDAYRNRWDDQWDPYGSIPRGNLSHHSHPSESHLSLNSFSSHNSSITFPIPSRLAVHKMAADQQDRRHPQNIRAVPVHLVRKEKHVRLTPPTDRRYPGPSTTK